MSGSIHDADYFSPSNVTSPSIDKVEQLDLTENIANEGQLTGETSWSEEENEYEYNDQDYIEPVFEQLPASIFSVADFMSSITKGSVYNQRASYPTSPKESAKDEIIDGNNRDYVVLRHNEEPSKLSLCTAAEELANNIDVKPNILTQSSLTEPIPAMGGVEQNGLNAKHVPLQQHKVSSMDCNGMESDACYQSVEEQTSAVTERSPGHCKYNTALAIVGAEDSALLEQELKEQESQMLQQELEGEEPQLLQQELEGEKPQLLQQELEGEEPQLLQQELEGEEPQFLQVAPTLQSNPSHREHSMQQSRFEVPAEAHNSGNSSSGASSRGSSTGGSGRGCTNKRMLASRILEFERDESSPHRIRYSHSPALLQSRSVDRHLPTSIDHEGSQPALREGSEQQWNTAHPPQCRIRVKSELDALVQYKTALLLQSKLVDQLLVAKEAVAGDTAESKLRQHMSVDVATQMLKEAFLDCELLGSIVLGDTQLSCPTSSQPATAASRHSRGLSPAAPVGFGSSTPRLAVPGPNTRDRRTKPLAPTSSANSPTGARMDLIRRTPTGAIDGAPLTSVLRRNHSNTGGSSDHTHSRGLFSTTSVIDELLRNPSAIHSLTGRIDNYCACCRIKLVDIHSHQSLHKKHMHCKNCIHR